MTLSGPPNRLFDHIVEQSAPFEFASFVLGFERRPDEDRAAHERRWRERKIGLGQALLDLWPERRIDFLRPDLRIDVRADESLWFQSAPLWIGGRYRKLSRRIPSSRWVHHPCKGRGCESCRFRGTLTRTSVQDLVAGPALAQSGGERDLFHGLGREDTDARMLGAGRPFLLEVHQPRRRSIDLGAIERQVAQSSENLVEVGELALVDRATMKALKSSAPEKSYRAWVEVDGGLPSDATRRASALAGAQITQYSPTRVMHRRGREVARQKELSRSDLLGGVGGLVVWEVRASSGTYIKELVSGDDGRTSPSLAAALGVPCRCKHLDVLEVFQELPWSTSQDELGGSWSKIRAASADSQ